MTERKEKSLDEIQVIKRHKAVNTCQKNPNCYHPQSTLGPVYSQTLSDSSKL